MSNSLSKYFLGIAAKRLSQVEIMPTSNQHEFNGILEMKEIFGTEKFNFKGKFILLSDEEDKIVEADGGLTWYDARERHATRTEYRLYYTTNDVIQNSAVGDLVIIARTGKKSLAVIIAPANSTSEKQLLWLFGLSEVGNKFIVKDLSGKKEDFGFAGKYIMSSLGFELEEKEDYLDLILKKFGKKFPSTNEFSEFARSTIKKTSPFDAPDETLLSWMEREELLFRTLEKHIVEEKLQNGFGKKGTDVDDFIQFSLSVQNRRKSRAGYAFENHLLKIFDAHKISYSRGKITELNKKPDFIFPGIKEYHDSAFDVSLLTMLGLKTSAKDRWRQVLSEAARIKQKHLITLEPSISKNQTDEMIAENLQLVIPEGITKTYSDAQQKQLLTLKEFISRVEGKQKNN
jgi:hypothetical protein